MIATGNAVGHSDQTGQNEVGYGRGRCARSQDAAFGAARRGCAGGGDRHKPAWQTPRAVGPGRRRGTVGLGGAPCVIAKAHRPRRRSDSNVGIRNPSRMGRTTRPQLNVPVLDASLVGAWYLPARTTPEATAFDALNPTPRWRAPHYFSYEVLNLLLRYERQCSVQTRAAEKVQDDLRRLLKVVAGPAPSRRMTALALTLARTHAISLFDGFYLLLAMELRAPLVTRDGRLATAATREGCAAFDVRSSR